MRQGLAMAGLAAAMMLSGGAVAQNPTGRSGHSTATYRDNTQAFTELSAFGRCFARSNRAGALALIATAPGSPEESALFNQLVSRREEICLGEGTNTSGSLIYWRGVIAEALLESNTAVPAELRQQATTVDQVRDLGGVARCYAAGHGAEVRALLETRPGSREELAASTALWPEFRRCLPPQVNVRLNAQWIRYLLAEALLRLPPAAPAAS